MATQTLVKHGTQAGYKAEKKAGNVCDRCRKASRVYYYQYSDAGKAQNLKFSTHDVIDNLYGQIQRKPTQGSSRATQPRQAPAQSPAEGATEPVQPQPDPDPDQPNPEPRGLGDRLSDALKGFTLGAERKPETYVESDEIPEYLRPLTPDPEPGGQDWSTVKEDEFLITPQGMELIQENMGTYLSVIGMTLELVDPYCGPILAENLENIVKRWSRVIAHYPRAAKFFMSETGGVIMEWIGAIQATWPVLFAIYEHHLARTIRTDHGRVMRVSPNGQREYPDATMPPMPDTFDYSVG